MGSLQLVGAAVRYFVLAGPNRQMIIAPAPLFEVRVHLEPPAFVRRDYTLRGSPSLRPRPSSAYTG